MSCKDCNKKVTYSYEYCPHCGADLNKERKAACQKYSLR